MQDFCSGRESDSLQTPNISSLPSKPGWPRVFDAQVQLAAVSPQIPSVERKEVEVCDGIVSFYGKLLLKAKGLWQTAFDVSQDRDDKAGWKDIRETKTLVSELRSPRLFIPGVSLCLPLGLPKG